MLTSSLRALGAAGAAAAFGLRRISCRPRRDRIGPPLSAGRASRQGTSGAAPRTADAAGAASAGRHQGLGPSRPHRSPAAAREAAACDRGSCSRSQDRRGCRGHGARTSGWRGSARSRHRPAPRAKARRRPRPSGPAAGTPTPPGPSRRHGGSRRRRPRPPASGRSRRPIRAPAGGRRRTRRARHDPRGRPPRGAAACRQPVGELVGEVRLGGLRATRSRSAAGWPPDCAGGGSAVRGVRAGAGRRRPMPAAPAGPRSRQSTAEACAACSPPPCDATGSYRSRMAKARRDRPPARSLTCCAAVAGMHASVWLPNAGNGLVSAAKFVEWPGADSGQHWGWERDGRIRLHRRRRRLGRRGAGGAAERGPAHARAAGRGGARQPSLFALSHQLRPADRPSRRQLALRVRSRARHRQSRDSRAARQAARRLERHQRSRLGARAAARLRHLGADGRARLELAGRGAAVHAHRELREGRRQRARHRRPAARHGGARPEPALRRAVQGRRRRRLQAQPGLQQRGPGRRRQDPGQHQPRPAHERGALLSRAGDAATQPARRHRGADAPRAAGRQALRRHRLRAAGPRGGGARRARGHPVRGRRGNAAAAGAVRHRQARDPESARHRRPARLAGGGREFPRPPQCAHRLAREGRARSPTITRRAGSAPSARR